MKPPFTSEQFFKVFENYNAFVFPAQYVFIFFGILALILLFSDKKHKNMFTGTLLGVFWIWMGLAYYLTFFTGISKAGIGFALLFLFEGIYLIYATFRLKIEFTFKRSVSNYLALFFIIFGIFLYPIIGYIRGEELLRTISLGLPCPTTIFTLGFLMFCKDKAARTLIIIPTVWSIIGISAALNFNITQDFLMVIAAITANISIWKKNKAINKQRRLQMHGYFKLNS